MTYREFRGTKGTRNKSGRPLRFASIGPVSSWPRNLRPMISSMSRLTTFTFKPPRLFGAMTIQLTDWLSRTLPQRFLNNFASASKECVALP
jgi:hypothetical protein